MKKIFGILFISLLVIGMASPAYCDDSMKKFGRGVCNILTCPFELFEQVKRVNNSDGPMAAMTYGAVKGIAMVGVRAIVGVFEVATFPIPVPEGYGPILKDPEFFFEETIW